MSIHDSTYTAPEVFAAALAGADWADPETDPTRIDWAARQAAAVIPFEVVNGRPVNPFAPTEVRYGRNELGHWGEQVCADALVVAHDPGDGRWIVMVERTDGHGWALPGGYVDPGEGPLDAAIRELGEEAQVDLPAEWLHRDRWHVFPPQYVPDPRASDEAWMVTVLATLDLGVWLTGPELTGGDDAKRAAWVRADNYAALVQFLADEYSGEVFAAHRGLLADALG